VNDVFVLVVQCGSEDANTLAADVRTAGRGLLDTVVVADAAGAARAARRIHDDGGHVPVVFVATADSDLPRGASDERGTATAIALHHDENLATARSVLVTSRASLHGVDAALQAGAVHGMITRPWTLDGLTALLRAQLATYLVEHAPDVLDRFDPLLDEDDRDSARRRAELQRIPVMTGSDAAHPLLDPDLDEAALEARLVTLLDRALGHPPRLRVAPGTILIEEGEDVGGIYVLLDGVVRMSSSTPTGHRILHEGSTGPILGVLSLANHAVAMLRCQAVTDVRAIPITIDQLRRALAAEHELSGLLLQVLITALARRLRRSDQMQMELDQRLAELSEARAQLVATARLTAVGEMAAGMAHELNNPTAALVRGVDHLADDVAALVDDPGLARAIERRRTAETLPTADLRAARRALTDAVGDRHLAERLLGIGVTDPTEAIEVATVGPAMLDRIEAAARVGATVRTVTGAAGSIRTLVDSLRAYLRGDNADGPAVPDVDVAAGVEDALRLLSYRLDHVEVHRRYEEVPTVAARPGALQQVWTNLISNALDAMDSHGHLTIEVTAPASGRRVRPDRVIVRVADNGRGVPDELQEQIFEPRFTTKGGQVRFGLGLGLSISRRIITDHGGTIAVQSRPGDTVFTVELPIGGPP
jgi:two-component system, NtrC family, sensor kinase